jgi:hypothetical protein
MESSEPSRSGSFLSIDILSAIACGPGAGQATLGGCDSSPARPPGRGNGPAPAQGQHWRWQAQGRSPDLSNEVLRDRLIDR